ncbi:uncharacterized protein I206_100937 [Kwoniella pini CBS 10737]|uniref:Uncharacterized protein n=1 Tax=Kwoniella pini CBS 10737 TaxID=1296096 RepID=A0A1B9IBS4_9TREE|nr:uncharacterized protein I206_00389 [Kwoniella pini CBS 10737]OCF53088.1 hypothetical protein I206_00389 [Kwoniella pini CBS 10737]
MKQKYRISKSGYMGDITREETNSSIIFRMKPPKKAFNGKNDTFECKNIERIEYDQLLKTKFNNTSEYMQTNDTILDISPDKRMPLTYKGHKFVPDWAVAEESHSDINSNIHPSCDMTFFALAEDNKTIKRFNVYRIPHAYIKSNLNETDQSVTVFVKDDTDPDSPVTKFPATIRSSIVHIENNVPVGNPSNCGTDHNAHNHSYALYAKKNPSMIPAPTLYSRGPDITTTEDPWLMRTIIEFFTATDESNQIVKLTSVR